MKKLNILLLVSLALLLMSLALNSSYRNALVEPLEGVFVFTDSRPADDYEYLGSIKAGITWSGDYREVKQKLIRRAKSNYPECDGIILNFAKYKNKADVIKFK